MPNFGGIRKWAPPGMLAHHWTDGVRGVQNRTPRIPQQPASNRAELDAILTVELASVVTGARRRALRDGDREIDTAHLLHSLIESDPQVRAAFDGGPQLAKVLGYLVQRSIGYGLRWQGAVEDTGALPMVPETGVDGWSPSAVSAMEGARGRAELRGDPRAGVLICSPRWRRTRSAGPSRCWNAPVSTRRCSWTGLRRPPGRADVGGVIRMTCMTVVTMVTVLTAAVMMSRCTRLRGGAPAWD